MSVMMRNGLQYAGVPNESLMQKIIPNPTGTPTDILSTVSIDGTIFVIKGIPDNAYLLNEVEGLPSDIATFADGSALPMSSLKVGIEPVQDLHGYDYPWAGGAGKNKVPKGASGTSSTGLTFTVNDNGSVTIKGTASATNFWGVQFTIPAGTYILNGCPSGGGGNTYLIDVRNTVGGTGISGINADVGNGSTFTINSELTAYLNIRTASGYSYPSSGLTFYPMIRLSSVTDATFEPYSNICPISGHTEANVVVSPTTDAEDGQTYNIQFKDGDNPLTVYGGTLDVVSGELKVVPYYASYNGETLEGEWISDRDVYAVGTTPTIGAQVVNIGATPTTYQLTPTQVKSLLGTNNVWADTGDIEELEYFSKEA